MNLDFVPLDFECFREYLQSFQVRVGKENYYEAELFDLHKNEGKGRRLLRHLVVV